MKNTLTSKLELWDAGSLGPWDLGSEVLKTEWPCLGQKTSKKGARGPILRKALFLVIFYFSVCRDDREGRPSAMKRGTHTRVCASEVELSGRGHDFPHAAEDDAGVNATQDALLARTVVGELAHQRNER